jgi:hypothetical protein
MKLQPNVMNIRITGSGYYWNVQLLSNAYPNNILTGIAEVWC